MWREKKSSNETMSKANLCVSVKIYSSYIQGLKNETH